MMKYIKFGIIAAGAFLLAGCVAGDIFQDSPEGIVMTGTDKSPLVKFAVEEANASYPVTVSSTGIVGSDVTVDIKIDNSLVESYNAANKTSYYSLPESVLKLEKNQVVIKAGSAASEAANLVVTSTDAFEDGKIYMIPVTITGVKGTSNPVIEASRTVYVRISRVVYFASLNMNNPSMSANFIFDDALAAELPQHTVEVKFFTPTWDKNDANSPIRMLGVYNKNEQGYLYRFGEGSYDNDQLQVNVSNGTPLVTNTRFATNTWHTLTVTCDGTATRLYVDGVKDVEVSNAVPLTLQRIELGMSWGGYRTKQLYKGRMAELRVWDRALSAGEIQLGICGVDPKSEGLVAYWKMNEGEGYKFFDATGHGYDMDWSKVCRDANEDGPLEDYDYSEHVSWLDDDNNRCAN